VAGSSERLTSRFYQLKMGRCLTGRRNSAQPIAGGARTREPISKNTPHWKAPAKDSVCEGAEGDWEREGSAQDPGSPRRCKCNQATLDVLSATDVGRGVPGPAEEDAQSEGVERRRSAKSRRGRRGVETEEVGAEGVERPLFLPTPSFMACGEDEWDSRGGVPECALDA